jgi:signal transduction histidine kinase
MGTHHIELIDGLPEAECRWLHDHSHEVQVTAGETFLQEHGPADEFYIVLEGEMQIIRTVNGIEQVIGTTPRGIVGGEIAMLMGTSSQMSARALVPSRLLVLDRRSFREMFAFAPTLGERVLNTAADRMQRLASSQVQYEKMAALGKLSAGLAHELNNPAAAVQRAALSLRETLGTLQEQVVALLGIGLEQHQVEAVVAVVQRSVQRRTEAEALTLLERSEREDELGDWLDERAIANGWEMAATFVEAGMRLDDLQPLADDLTPQQFERVLAWMHHTLEATGLVGELEQSVRRISELVGAIKSYTYKDQGKPQEVDIHKGLESTLVVLSHKLKRGNVEVVRQYDAALPRICARGGELNQVWTNLIDNAIDAIGEAGTIRLITRHEHNFVMVEVADNGSGIPPAVIPRLFEPFFTTKEAGAGTGLGLDISYRIIQEHNGSIEVQSEPGHTRFIVRLPVGNVG